MVLLFEMADYVNLVFHQRDQRRYDYRRPLEHKGRQLVAQGLAAPCRHEDEHVLAVEETLDDLKLASLERVKAEMMFQSLVYFIGIRHLVEEL